MRHGIHDPGERAGASQPAPTSIIGSGFLVSVPLLASAVGYLGGRGHAWAFGALALTTFGVALPGSPAAGQPASNAASTGTCSAVAIWLVLAARPTMAMNSACWAGVMPLARAAAVCECTQ